MNLFLDVIDGITAKNRIANTTECEFDPLPLRNVGQEGADWSVFAVRDTANFRAIWTRSYFAALQGGSCQSTDDSVSEPDSAAIRVVAQNWYEHGFTR